VDAASDSDIDRGVNAMKSGPYAVNGPYSLTACSLTINSLVFHNDKVPYGGGGAPGPSPMCPDGACSVP
jgi:hypothetical protein